VGLIGFCCHIALKKQRRHCLKWDSNTRDRGGHWVRQIGVILKNSFEQWDIALYMNHFQCPLDVLHQWNAESFSSGANPLKWTNSLAFMLHLANWWLCSVRHRTPLSSHCWIIGCPEVLCYLMPYQLNWRDGVKSGPQYSIR
jgi:hypothetical protein